jgi:hypothetical protein
MRSAKLRNSLLPSWMAFRLFIMFLPYLTELMRSAVGIADI